ncbi:deubiquitinase OTUD6B isoform X2 [Zerene cesonia]|uniref:deubiquitinase OTUD6B isoform X2 n=1 Tax=Zerene cesonia TaxID=33412 RepID=UPI0018E580D1|nr:deubiquitinase OTUD6B isoform X2 [Zerene cesonia]
MEDNIDDFSSLSIENRHKKERKELQAKIQGLKKVAKNDKSRKKELTAEIARLEMDIDIRHKKEIEESQKQCLNEDEVIQEINSNENNEEVAKSKLSKARKRRDKKSQQERDREEQIKLQEKENLNGPRNKEIQEISSRLRDKGLTIYSIPSDGDCLYKAISHQLALKKDINVTVEELRNNVATHIRTNKDEFLPFLTNSDTYEMLTDDEFYEYCDNIINTKVWGGQLEIRALSNILKCPITVIQATGPEAIEQGQEYPGPSLIISYHRHMYSLGEHYNSTQVLNDIDSYQ